MKKYEPYYGREDDFQKSVAYLLDACNLLWFHPPNGGKRSKSEAGRFKMQGVKPGVPDCVIMEPRGKWHGLVIELKVKGGKLSNYQKEWLNALKTRNYKTAVCWSIDEVEDVIKEYLNE